MNTPSDIRTVQGYELQWVWSLPRGNLIAQGVNVLGPFIFTKELLPLLLDTAKETPRETRVIWFSSIGHLRAPTGTINFTDVNLPKADGWIRYGQSKAVLPFQSKTQVTQAAIVLAKAMADKFSDQGLLSFSVHPGMIKSVSHPKIPT